VFIAYPVATLKMEGSAFWCFLLGLTLFLLGVDSAFSMVEAVATVLHDTKTFANVNRTLMAFVLCLIGLAISALFCTNWGFVLFDCIDHYLGNYLLLLVGILQCCGVGWAFDTETTNQKGENYRKSLSTLTWGFFIFLFITGVWSIDKDTGKFGMLAFLGCLCCFVLPISFLQCEAPVMDWYSSVVMCGVRRIGYSMSKLGRDNYGPDKGNEKWYEQYFVFYWCITIKYLIPAALWFILLYVIKKDIKELYGGYKLYWQIIGLIVPITGLVAFLVNLCCCVDEEKLNEDEFDYDWHEPTKDHIGEVAWQALQDGMAEAEAEAAGSQEM